MTGKLYNKNGYLKGSEGVLNKKLYVSDLDGTLLNDKAELSSYTREKLLRLLKKKIMFTVASARSIKSIQKILEGIQLPLPVIEFNGAFISELETGKHLIINDIHTSIKVKILEDILAYNQVPFVSAYNGSKDLLYYQNTLNKGMAWYLENRRLHKDPRLSHIPCLRRVMTDHIICFTVIGQKKKLLPLKEHLSKKYHENVEIHFMENKYSKGWYWLTVHDKKATKDQAIQKLLTMQNSTIEEVVVFGDSYNDIKMFKSADQSIAVENANDTLKKYATCEIGKNTDDSVVKYIMQDSKKENF